MSQDTKQEDALRIVVDERFLETFGTGTLLGTIVNESTGVCPSAIVLVFPETSIRWRTENGGPAHIIVTEFAIRLLLEDVDRLHRMGIAVAFETVTKDPKPRGQ